MTHPRKKQARFGGLFFILAVFVAMAALLFAERSGIRYSSTAFTIPYQDKTQVKTARLALMDEPVSCMLLMDSRQSGVSDFAIQWDRILLDMKVAHQTVDVAQTQDLPAFDRFSTVILLMPNIDPLEESIIELMSWVRQGGGLLMPMTPERTAYFDVIAQRLGIQEAGWDYEVTESIVPADGFMLGAGRYNLSDPFDSSLSLTLNERARVYASSGDKGTPLIWSNDYGAGRIVVDNIGIYDKIMRGFYAASYSLLGDACAYPVINGAAFYLDDFPSPVPGGDGEYVRRDYQMSVADFYSRVWWPDVARLSETYRIRFTGVMIENYEDEVNRTARQTDLAQFRYYGGLLLRLGGEIGYHGYNHQPLCLPNTDYGDHYGYRSWPTESAMENAVSELIRFQQEVLPNADGRVYVPPSNILSAEGRRLLSEKFPQIRTIASTYFYDYTGLAYEQEFEVADDGIVEQPRVISGGVLDDYMRLAAFAELNMHFVSTHFMHPDDLLDVDRGAELGWEAYKRNLTDYIQCLTASAPDLRMLTGSELAAAIQRFSPVTVALETGDDEWTLRLGNFTDEAWLFFRANNGTPGSVKGGSISHLTGSLYLIQATGDTVTIERK